MSLLEPLCCKTVDSASKSTGETPRGHPCGAEADLDPRFRFHKRHRASSMPLLVRVIPIVTPS